MAISTSDITKFDKLTFQFIGNACGVFTGKRGTKILCDPWLVDGVFDGSWCHFPKLKTTYDNLQAVDAIYISHLHPDHFDERYFNFELSTPLIVLNHGPNFLIKRLESLGYHNLIKIKDRETVSFREFEITMFAPFAKHNFYEAAIGNLIDSAILISCDGVSALNANDNTPSVEAAKLIGENYPSISLAMLNYNAAGPYPSCFDNLSEQEKLSESKRVLDRNFSHMREVIRAICPKYVLPFAGAYVLGGKFHFKNKYLGTATWDECANWLKITNIEPSKVVLLREGDILDIEQGKSTVEYQPMDLSEMQRYIEQELSQIKYQYETEQFPDQDELKADLSKAAEAMIIRMKRYGISSTFKVILEVFGQFYQIYPCFEMLHSDQENGNRLICSMDERLLRRILDRKSHWNNAEIGAHISFKRYPNNYEPDLHTGLQFLHL